MARIDSAILHEIAGIVQSRSKVPDRVRILKRQFQITYLDDHRQRMEDAIRRHDTQLLNMLFGQLASKVKYQALRGAAASPSRRTTVAGRASRSGAAKSTAAPKRSTAPKPATTPKRSTTPKRATTQKRTTTAKTPTAPKRKKRASGR